MAATKIMQITQELAAVEQYRNNIDIAQNNLVLEESTLTTVTNLIQRTQELAVAAANTAPLSVNEYQILASEVEEQLKELVNLVKPKTPMAITSLVVTKLVTLPLLAMQIVVFVIRVTKASSLLKLQITQQSQHGFGKTAFLDIQSSK